MGLDRQVADAVDLARQHRLLVGTGGDSVALADIVAAQEAVAARPEPDLTALARLAVHRCHLTVRNESLPLELPAVWVSLGDPDRGEAIARSITHPSWRVAALARYAEALAAAGDPDRAEQVTLELAGTDAHVDAVTGVAGAVAAGGDADRAERVARTVGGPADLTRALSAVACAAVKRVPDRARTLAAEAAQAAEAAHAADPRTSEEARAAAVDAAIAMGELRRAEAALPTLTWSASVTVPRLVAALIAAGDRERAEAVANATADRYGREHAQVELLTATAMAGDLATAEAVADTLTGSAARVLARVALVRAHVVAGTGGPRAQAAAAVAAAREVAAGPERATTVVVLARAVLDLLADGSVGRAPAILTTVERIAHSVEELDWRSSALTKLALLAAGAEISIGRCRRRQAPPAR